MRVYFPSTLRLLAAALDAGELAPAPLTGFAVTPTLREWYAEGDQEELEYVALTAAARASLRLLDLDDSAPRRRVVVAAEVPDGDVTSTPDERAAVRVGSAVPMAKVAAAHVDAEDAEPAVRAAAAVVLEADLGSDDAQFTVDEAEGHELQWYATQELAEVISRAS